MFDVEKNKLRVTLEVGSQKSLSYQFLDLNDGSFGGDLPKNLKGLNEVKVYIYQGNIRKDFPFYEYFSEDGGTLTKIPDPLLTRIRNLVFAPEKELDLVDNVSTVTDLNKETVEFVAQEGADLIESFKNIDVKYYKESSIKEIVHQVYIMKYEGFKNELQEEMNPGGNLVLEVPSGKVVAINNFDGSKKLPKSVQDLVMKDYIDNMQALLMKSSNIQRKEATIVVGGVKLK